MVIYENKLVHRYLTPQSIGIVPFENPRKKYQDLNY